MTIGWLPREIDDLTLDDLSDLMHHWQNLPPAHITLNRIYQLVGAYLGVDVAPKATAKNQTTGEQAIALAKKFGAKNG